MEPSGRSPALDGVRADARPRSQTRAVFALGLQLARSGFTAALAAGATVAGVAGFGALALFLAHGGKREALPGVPLLASSALAFGIGLLVAFAASSRAFRRDEDEGIRGLLRVRAVGATAYLAARVAGLAVVLAVLVGGGSAAVGLIATLASRGGVTALRTAQASLAAVVFSVAFAVTFAPVAMAALAARSRRGGYLVLFAILFLPELIAPSFGSLVERRWLDVCSIPGALLALRASLAPVGVDPFMFGRALVALSAILAASLLVARAEVASRASAGPERGRSRSGRT